MQGISPNPCPKVSVVCPSYNHAPYLRQALDSILMQKANFPFEVLIGEDCSPDHSREILKEYEQQHPGFFQMFYREKNIGATNNGLDLFLRTKGKYIIVLETDDYWVDPYKLQKQADFLDIHPEYIGCANNYIEIDENGDTVCFGFDDWTGGQNFTLQDFLDRGAFVFQAATFMYRNFFLDGGDYSIITKASSMVGDFTINSILLLRGCVFLMPEPMSVYRRIRKKDNSSFSSQPLEKVLVDQMRQMVMLEGYFQGEIEYVQTKHHCVIQYFYNWFKREEGFSTEGLWHLWKQAGPAAQKKAAWFILSYPVRKLHKCWNRFLKKEDSHE